MELSLFQIAFYILFAGILVGVLAGLFGVGGGVIVVPILTFIYRKLNIPEEILAHLAIGTSLATIFFTSFASLYKHNKNQAVLWKIIGNLIPGILLGAYGGSFFASSLKSSFLIGIFIAFIFFFSIRMLFFEREPRISTDKQYLPSRVIQGFIGFWIGFFSSLVGIGGGVFTSTYLLYYRTPIHLAIGTSAAIGFPIALAGSLSYLYVGWSHPLLPPGCVGFIYVPALAGIALGSIPSAYLGATLSHRMDKKQLKRLFAIFLLCMGMLMLFQEVRKYIQ